MTSSLETTLSQPARVPIVRLLDAEPDLGASLTALEFELARMQAVLPAAELTGSDWEPSMLSCTPGVRGHVHGFLLLSGVITLELRFAHRACARLIVPGDLVLLDEIQNDTISPTWRWSMLQPAQIAVLDGRLLIVAQRWPQILSAILTKAAAQARQAQLQHAIGQVPRVEDRLIFLFWSLADRIGTMRPEGIWVPLPMTQNAIGRMIGARRPTVSLALAALTEQRMIIRLNDGWLIDRRSLAHIAESAR